jgi:hypothetical protein
MPSLFDFAPGGVYLASAVTAAAVRFYRTLSPLPARRLQPLGLGGLLSVALSLNQQSLTSSPGVTRHRSSLEPGLSSPIAIKQQQRPPGPLADGYIAA